MSSERVGELRRDAGTLAFVISGPSGAGKTTVINRVLQAVPSLTYSVSHTTRSMRTGEVEGADYVFATAEVFDRMVANDEFVEHVVYAGDRYGTSRGEIARQAGRGLDVVLNIDVQGAKRLRRVGLGPLRVVYVFLTPSSLALLGERLRSRGTEDERVIANRLRAAGDEMKDIRFFDYLVINDDLDAAVEELSSVIIAERIRLAAGGTLESR